MIGKQIISPRINDGYFKKNILCSIVFSRNYEDLK